MKKEIRLTGEMTCICGKCKGRYNLVIAARKASDKGEKEVRCPHCLAVVGRM